MQRVCVSECVCVCEREREREERERERRERALDGVGARVFASRARVCRWLCIWPAATIVCLVSIYHFHYFIAVSPVSKISSAITVSVGSYALTAPFSLNDSSWVAEVGIASSAGAHLAPTIYTCQVSRLVDRLHASGKDTLGRFECKS